MKDFFSKKMPSDPFFYYKLTHFLVWCFWALSYAKLNSQKRTGCHTALFSRYFGYDFFKYFEMFFMFGGGILLLIFLSQIIKNWAYVIFELLFVFIIAVNLSYYFHCK